MTPDDPRHGTHAGYIAGCGCEPCQFGHFRANKERKYYREVHGSCRFDHDAVAEVLRPWLEMGISINAICKAAKFGNRTDFLPVYNEKRKVNRKTYRALANIKEDDFPDTAFLYGDLTRTRIYSLMAAGHPLKDMPILDTGQWRTRKNITIGQARSIRDHYRKLEGSMGTSKHTASRARNAGHLPPLGWDDPGTLAWPGGKPNFLPADESEVAVDEVKVQRVLAGIKQDCNTAERLAVIDQWAGSINELERLTGWNIHRTIARNKAA